MTYMHFDDGRMSGTAVAAPWQAVLRRHWLALLGAAILILPTFATIAEDSWSTEQGAHGPVVLATGIWLVFHLRASFLPFVKRPPVAIAFLALLPCCLIYALGRISGTPELEGFALYTVLVVATFAYIGLRAMRQIWFAIFYFAFVFPPPDSLVAVVTQPLKLGISRMAVDLLGGGLRFPDRAHGRHHPGRPVRHPRRGSLCRAQLDHQPVGDRPCSTSTSGIMRTGAMPPC